LLAFYHRTYDAWFVLLPVAWVLARLRTLPTLISTGVLCGGAAFLLPGPAALKTLEGRGVIPADIAAGAAWQYGALAHQVWLLAALALIVALECRRVSAPVSRSNEAAPVAARATA
jgi:hypothetical protein